MLTKRIIPCLDVHNGRTVKGLRFRNLRDVGDPVAMACWYCAQGADELAFLDVSASIEGRSAFVEVVERIGQEINIPFTVGGGISSVEVARLLLRAGADKISINSAAVGRPELINELAGEFGSQAVVVAIDAWRQGSSWRLRTHGANIDAQRDVVAWAIEASQRGAGEILLTSIDHDGVRAGFATELTGTVAKAVNIPIIASGGAGAINHFIDVFATGLADAALAASIFHSGDLKIPQLKQSLKRAHIEVRYGT